ncbi:hypothetical protein BDY24DRAFT_388499 [Mrakia frigida]|uniref:sumo domain-containing protein n=1 Tax=Mrakia frigida TaxID=29902 RepID=UPI003FCC042F
MDHARPPLASSRVAEIHVGLGPGESLGSQEEPGHVCAEEKQVKKAPTASKKGKKVPVPSFPSLRSSSSSSSKRNVKPNFDLLTVTVEYGAEEGMKFAVLPHQTLGELKAAFTSKLGVPPKGYRFFFDGNLCLDEHTFFNLGLEDGDDIYANVEQKGGKPVIYVYPPQPMDVACRLSLTRDWSFSAVYPQVDEKLLPDGGQSVLWRARVEKNGDMKMLSGLPSDGNVEVGLEVAYLYWEAFVLPSCISVRRSREETGGENPREGIESQNV